MPSGSVAGRRVHGHAGSAPLGEANGRRTAVAEGRMDHVPELVLVPGGHEDDVRHVPEIGDVVDPLVGRPVVGDDARAVQGEDDGQVLEADVVIDLVVGPLEERRVDGDDRLEARDRQARRRR